MRSARQNKVDVAVAECLANAEPYMLPESILRADAARLVVPRPSETELTDSLGYHDRSARLTSVRGETEPKWKLNDAGRAWLQENR